ncbi:MAG: hypothetical protein JEY96_19440 [Bacteroidales bacterium]|nr:hypothetical protein [Bacteroidales bacterium]
MPNNVVNSKNISGVYKNESILSPFGNQDLWHCLKRWSRIENDNHLVYLSLHKRTIQAQLIKDNVIVDQKKIRGTLTDSCFVVNKKYLIIPILPILWGYNNQQIRISVRDSSLIVDEFTEDGGVMIIMAGGDDRNRTYEYVMINEKDSINTAP